MLRYYRGKYSDSKDFLTSIETPISDNDGYIYIFNLLSSPKRIKVGHSNKIYTRFSIHASNAACYGDTKLNDLLIIGIINNVLDTENKLKRFANENLTAISSEWFDGDINILFDSHVIKDILQWGKVEKITIKQDILNIINEICITKNVDYLKLPATQIRNLVNAKLKRKYSLDSIMIELSNLVNENLAAFDIKYNQWTIFMNRDYIP